MKSKFKIKGLSSVGIFFSTYILFGPRILDDWFFIVLTVLSMAFFIYFAWFYKEGPKGVFEKLFVSLYLVLSIISLFLKARASVLITTCYFFAALCYSAYKFFANKDRFSYELMFYAAVYLCLARFVNNYTFLSGDFAFLKASLIITAAAVVTVIVLILIKKIRFENFSLLSRVVLVVAAGIITLALSVVTLQNLNYCLDSSKPLYHSTPIVAKDYQRRTKGADKYYIKVVIDGKKYTFKVNRNEYYNAEVGDNFDAWLYEGALSEPYFIR